VIATEPGLYFVGLFFLSAATSSLVGGVGRDAAFIAKHIVSSELNSWRQSQERPNESRNDIHAIHA
jgi:putative flavoprotein involved in K+ transport